LLVLVIGDQYFEGPSEEVIEFLSFLILELSFVDECCGNDFYWVASRGPSYS